MSKQDTSNMSMMQKSIYHSFRNRMRHLKDGHDFAKIVMSQYTGHSAGISLGQRIMAEASLLAHDNKKVLQECMDSLRKIISEENDKTMMEAFECVNRRGVPPNGWLERYPNEVMISESAISSIRITPHGTHARQKAYQRLIDKWREYHTYMLPPRVRSEAGCTFRI